MRTISRFLNRMFAPLCFLIILSATISGGERLNARLDSPTLRDYVFSNAPLATILNAISNSECLNVVIDPSVAVMVENTRSSLRITNASAARALQVLLESHYLNYEYAGYKTLVVFKGELPKTVKSMDVTMRSMSLSSFVRQIAGVSGFKIRELSGDLGNLLVTMEMRNVSGLRAFEAGLSLHGLTYQRVECDTIVIFTDRSTVVP